MELISLVFNHLYARHEKNKWEPLIKDPISQTLLPFVRQSLFKKLRFTKLNRFLDFCEMVKGTKFIVDSVQELEVDDKSRSVELSAESESSVLAFFASAIQIRQLRCTNPTLSHLVLSYAFASNLPSNSIINQLETRIVAGSSTVTQELRQIGRWQSLRKLVLVVVEGVRVGGDAEGDDLVSNRHLNVTELSLTVLDTPGTGRSEEVVEFVKSFPELTTIGVMGRTGNFNGILDGLDKEKIRTLRLSRISNDLLAAAVDCTDALLPFRHLTYLQINADIFTSNLVNKINQLGKLERLVLLPLSSPQTPLIEKLLTTARPKSLKLIFLSYITYKDAEDGDFYDDPEFAAMRPWEDEIPNWPSDLSFTKAKSLRELAKKEGVNLGAKFAAAIKSQANYDRFVAERDRDMMEMFDEADMAEYCEAMEM